MAVIAGQFDLKQTQYHYVRSEDHVNSCLVHSMRRYLQCLPLLGLAPLAHFLGFYLAGLGTINGGLGMFIGAIGLYPLILAVALVFGFVAPTASNFVRYSSCM